MDEVDPGRLSALETSPGADPIAAGRPDRLDHLIETPEPPPADLASLAVPDPAPPSWPSSLALPETAAESRVASALESGPGPDPITPSRVAQALDHGMGPAAEDGPRGHGGPPDRGLVETMQAVADALQLQQRGQGGREDPARHGFHGPASRDAWQRAWGEPVSADFYESANPSSDRRRPYQSSRRNLLES